jgi:hypothetical protein
MVTDDDERHTMPACPASMTAIVALAQADTVLARDPHNRTLIAANIVGWMPWTTRDGPRPLRVLEAARTRGQHRGRATAVRSQ